MAKNQFTENVNLLNGVGAIADAALKTEHIDSEQHQKIKEKVRDLERDNIFKAMAEYCK